MTSKHPRSNPSARRIALVAFGLVLACGGGVLGSDPPEEPVWEPEPAPPPHLARDGGPAEAAPE
jgi:hypothetical protein